MNCPTCGAEIAGGKLKRICSRCFLPISRDHKWEFNAHGQCQHKHCDDPRFQSAEEKAAVVNREMPLFDEARC